VRRPQPTFNNEQEIATTIGEGGAVMKLGAAVTLRIPEGALRDGMNIRFALSTSNPSKSAPPRLGQSFTLEPKIRSAGPPFELSFALPEGASAVDLVVRVAPDPKQKAPQKSDHRLIAPKRVDATKKLALFELEELPGADVYLTKQSAPTASANATSPAK
jgi:hypothetical protein